MGEIGDYWREHKDYARRKRSADEMGLSLRAYDKLMKRMDDEDRSRRKTEKLAKHTIRCECGKTFDEHGYRCHKQSKGKAGHKAMPFSPVSLQEGES